MATAPAPGTSAARTASPSPRAGTGGRPRPWSPTPSPKSPRPAPKPRRRLLLHEQLIAQARRTPVRPEPPLRLRRQYVVIKLPRREERLDAERRLLVAEFAGPAARPPETTPTGAPEIPRAASGARPTPGMVRIFRSQLANATFGSRSFAACASTPRRSATPGATTPTRVLLGHMLKRRYPARSRASKASASAHRECIA
jgi:hypothetical protein